MGCYNQALIQVPNYIDAIIARGAAHLNDQQFNNGLNDLLDAWRKEPENAHAIKYLTMTISHFEERHISLPSILKPFLNFMRLKTAGGESSPNNNADMIRTKAADGSIDNKQKDKSMKDDEKNFKNFSSSKSKDVLVSSVDTLSSTSDKKSKK